MTLGKKAGGKRSDVAKIVAEGYSAWKDMASGQSWKTTTWPLLMKKARAAAKSPELMLAKGS
jgi:hypothetical protein